MPSVQCVQKVAVFISLAMLLVQHSAEARSLVTLPRQTATAPSARVSSSAAGARHRRILGAPVKAPSAPLPADAFVMASPCPATAAAAGSTASAVFTVGAHTAPELFKEVALQVDFPKALWPSASLSCKANSGQAINCDAPEVSPEDLAQYDVVSAACMLGDMASTGPVTCTLSYTIPAAPLPASDDASRIVAAITYADLAENVVEDSSNNAAATCVTAPAKRQV